MKKILLAFVILFVLTSCNQNTSMHNDEDNFNNKISTYKEVIKDGKVEIDGISYDIKSVTKTTYTYDDNKNIIEKVITNDGFKSRIEYLYRNNQLIEDRGYSNDELSYTTYYYYEDDLLIKRKTVSKGGLEVFTEYSYGTKTKTQTHHNSDGNISFIATAYLDDDDKILKAINTTANGEVITSTTFHYNNDLLVKSIREKDGIDITTFNYEYNNIGNQIVKYFIFHGEINTLVATFYDYEYDENLLPRTVTMYRV